MKKYNLIKLLILLFALFISFNLQAQNQEIPPQERTLEKPNSTKNGDLPEKLAEELRVAEEHGDSRFFQEFLNMLVTLGILIAALMFAMWIFKRMFTSGIQPAEHAISIKIIERRNLSPRSTIFIVNVLGKSVAIAESTNGITMLTESPKSQIEHHAELQKTLDKREEKKDIR